MTLELIFQVLPVSTSTETDYYISETIVTYPPHHNFTIATGWNLANAQHHQANNFGFLSTRDFIKDQQATALIGDSFVEANMLKEEQRLGEQLEQLVPNLTIYSMGGPGSSLLDYIERIKFSQQQFDIHNFLIVIETGDVKQTLCGSGNIHAYCIDPSSLEIKQTTINKQTSIIKKIARKSALAQYLFSQLQIEPQNLFKTLFAMHANQTATASNTALPASERVAMPTVDAIVNTFLDKLPSKNDARVMLIFDDYRNCDHAIQAPPTPVRNRFIELAIQKNLQVIDTKNIFCQFQQENHLNSNVSPSDHHWNPIAIKYLANSISEQIQNLTTK